MSLFPLQLTLRDTELCALRAQNALLKQEFAQQEINQDEVVKRAREDRDQAIARYEMHDKKVRLLQQK